MANCVRKREVHEGRRRFQQTHRAHSGMAAAPHQDLWGFEVDTPVPDCLIEIRTRSEREWSAFVEANGEDACATGTAEAKELVRRCGICPSRRRGLWMVWSGAQALKEDRQARYSALVLKAADEGYRSKYQAQFEQVEVDLERTFPEHQFFRKGDARAGLDTLRRILTAFIVDSPEVGYTQSMNYIAAFMMLVVELDKPLTDEESAVAEEDAFWLTYCLCRRAISGYHSPDLGGLRTDLHVFNTLVAVKMSELSEHLTRLGFPKIDFIVSRWFLCCYFGVLPAETAVRVMDLFFAATHGGSALGRDGPTVLMRVGLGLLKWIEPTLLEVTPNDSIKACMAIQAAGGDVMCAADLDILLYTAFEEVGGLQTIHQMRSRLDHATGDEDAESSARDRRKEANSSGSEAAAATSAGDLPAPGTGKRKRRTVARVWDEDAARTKAQNVTRSVAAEEQEASKRPAGMPISSPGRPTPSSSASKRRFTGHSSAAKALKLSWQDNIASSPAKVNSSPFRRLGSAKKLTVGSSSSIRKGKSIARLEGGEIDFDALDRCSSTSSQEGMELTDLSSLPAAAKMRVLLADVDN